MSGLPQEQRFARPFGEANISPPIEILPFDVLSIILTVVCRGAPEAPTAKRTYGGVDFYYADHHYRHYRRLTTLRQVCKHWFNVIASIPVLWGLIHMDSRDFSIDRFRNSLIVAQEKRAPLDIHLYWNHQTILIDIMLEALALLVPLVEQWRRFFLWANMGKHSASTLLKLLVLPANVKTAYLLQNVSLCFPQNEGYWPAHAASDVSKDRLLLSAAPSLSSLRMFEVPDWVQPVACNNLTYLEYAPPLGRDTSLDHLITTLRAAPNLVTIKVKLEGLVVGGSEFTSGANPVSLPFLQNLSIRATFSVVASSFLSLIDFPRLHTLLLFDPDHSKYVRHDIISSLNVLSTKDTSMKYRSLAKLIISKFDPDHIALAGNNDYCGFLASLPQLSTLYIDNDMRGWADQFDVKTLEPLGLEPLSQVADICPSSPPQYLDLHLAGLRDEQSYLSAVERLAVPGRPWGRLVLVDGDFEHNSATIQALKPLVQEIKIIDPSYVDLADTFMSRKVPECAYTDVDMNYEPPADDAEMDEDSSTWDTDSEHSTESGEWASGDDVDGLVAEFRSLLVAGTWSTTAHPGMFVTPSSDEHLSSLIQEYIVQTQYYLTQ